MEEEVEEEITDRIRFSEEENADKDGKKGGAGRKRGSGGGAGKSRTGGPRK